MIDSFTGAHRFLSNFFPAQVWYDGILFPSVEHAYQACKTENKGERILIARLKTAGEAKREGKRVKMHNQREWDAKKIGIMRDLLMRKFADKGLATMLLNTGEEELVEGNDWGDRFWGKVDGHGQNWLGRLLMEVRDFLKNDGAIV